MKLKLFFVLLTNAFAKTSLDLTSLLNPVPIDSFKTGYSIEYEGILRLFINYGNNVINSTSIPQSMLNLKVINLFKELVTVSKSSKQNFVLRVGGQSADTMWWRPSRLGPWGPLNVPVSPAHLIVLQQVCVLTGMKLILNIGMVFFM